LLATIWREISMNKFHGKLVAGLASVAFFGLLGSALAQEPGAGAAPAYAPAPAPAPAASDMSGQLGIGVGVGAGGAGSSLISTKDAEINMKYWLSDTLSVMPQLALTLTSASGNSTAWRFAPAALMLYCPWKTTSTRLSVGAGLGLSFGKTAVASPAPAPDTTITIRLPIYAGVEHFFTRWFSMGIAVQDDFLYYTKTGPTHTFGMAIDNTSESTNPPVTAVGFLFFYTD
jgi:hypothetical protein